jgi:hypothetical protein
LTAEGGGAYKGGVPLTVFIKTKLLKISFYLKEIAMMLLPKYQISKTISRFSLSSIAYDGGSSSKADSGRLDLEVNSSNKVISTTAAGIAKTKPVIPNNLLITKTVIITPTGCRLT